MMYLDVIKHICISQDSPGTPITPQLSFKPKKPPSTLTCCSHAHTYLKPRVVLIIHYKLKTILKPGVRQLKAGAPGFLKLLLSMKSVCMCVCVCVCPRSRGYKLHSRNIESVQPAEQVCCI